MHGHDPTPTGRRVGGPARCHPRYVPDSASWAVEAFGENILDEEYIKDAGNSGDSLGMPTFIAGRPASYGLVFKLKL